MIKRNYYLKKIESYIDKPFIKVLAGVRRAGKSSLLVETCEILKARGVPSDKIAYINFDSLDYTDIREKAQLVQLEKDLLSRGVKYFLFDEIQNIEKWDEAISALYAEKDTDIYISGSNSKLLSSELSTFLTGRYVDIRVYTLNFSEYIDFLSERSSQEISDTSAVFDEYLRRGGFPSIANVDQSQMQDDEEVSDILASIIFRDLVDRKKLRNTELLLRVTKFVFDNVGNVFSAKSIADFLKNEKIAMSQETVYKYLNWLEEALIIERVRRYDIRGKEHLKTQDKFYLADFSLLYALNGRSESYLSGVLENVVYHELVSKGYSVSIGKNDDREIDFIAEKDHKKIYLQVCASLTEEKTREREFGAFDGVADNYPKFVLSLDEPRLGAYNVDGVESRYLPDFLLNEI